MPRILQLDHHVVNKIAAGEVIERPASVVKELLENSIDALATRVDIDVVAGGTELIRLVDNGEGIHPDDLPLAISCHATSKLRDADDLFKVQTMGFRGEALASIAEVSRFRLRSRQADFPTGSEIVVDAGAVSPVATVGCPIGTTIEVRDLFCNLPVRRKFLKQAPTEFGHVSEQFTRIAIANSRVHLVLRHNERTVYDLPPTDRLVDRIELFFGADLAKQLIPVEAEFRGARIWGYVGHPSESRSTRKGQYLFLNGRWIQDRSLQHALTEAYRGLLMVGRNPVSFLFLETPPESVDVNVHPTKAEVRFRDSQSLYRLVLSTIRNRFLGMDLESPLSLQLAGGGLKLEPYQKKSVDPAAQHAAQQDLVNWVQQQASLFQPAGADFPAANEVAPPTIAAPMNSPVGDPFARSSAGIEFNQLPDSTKSAPHNVFPATTGTAPSADSLSVVARIMDGTIGSQAHSGTESDPDQSVAGHATTEANTSYSAHRPESAAASDRFLWSSSPAAAKTLQTGFIDHAAGGNTIPAAIDQSTAPDAVLHSSSNESAINSQHDSMSPSAPTIGELADAVRKHPPALPDNIRAMQIHDSYLVVESDEGLTVVDQHALHERILYEHLRTRVLSGGVESQRLLVPLPVELPPAQCAALLEHIELLGTFGLKLQDFGGNTLLVAAYPVMLRRLDPANLLKDLSEQILETGRDPTRREMLDSILHMMSCKGAVKAGQRLTPDEIESLLAQRHLIDDAHHCPHGRPTALVLSRAELDRQFGRLGS